jgi:hypothetical protein
MQLDELHELIQTLKDHSLTYSDKLRKNEALTRYTLIDPFLRELGWDTGNPAQVIPEYQAGGGRADYALLHEGKPVIMIEAKSLGSNLHDTALIQGITYCVGEGTPYFAVTDGMIWEVYETFKQVPTEQKLLAKFDLGSTPPTEAVLSSLIFWRLNVESRNLTTAGYPIVVPPEEPPIVVQHPRHPVDLPSISRDELRLMPAGEVGLYPSKPSGIDFLTANKAWGFVKIRRAPRYFAIYISQPVLEIQFIGEVDRILDPAVDNIPDLEHTDATGHGQPGRKLITFKDGRLWKLSEPITYGIPNRRGKAPQNLQFHQFSKFVDSATLDDLRA